VLLLITSEVLPRRSPVTTPLKESPMSHHDADAPQPDTQSLLMKRRTFVGASVAVGGAVAAIGLFDGCGNRSDAVKTATVVRLRINGEAREVTVDNRTSLLDMLREQVGLTGTKKGCDQGACGACTVMINDQRVVSCLTLAVQADGAEITTIEGLERNGRLHPLQQAFIDEDGFQCGYCTAGQIVSGIGCIREGHAGSPEEIREWMSGNICRCGAYTNIVTAVSRVAQQGGA
jgi:xanthine dehydrogenase YagT iron-sulfur-binding subunit